MTQGQALGSVCAIDRAPRPLSPEQWEALRALSREVPGATLASAWLGAYVTEPPRADRHLPPYLLLFLFLFSYFLIPLPG